jgi:hypothetical protein
MPLNDWCMTRAKVYFKENKKFPQNILDSADMVDINEAITGCYPDSVCLMRPSDSTKLDKHKNNILSTQIDYSFTITKNKRK